jgi:hypothetical protein
MKNVLNQVLVTYWNEDNDVIKEEQIVSSWEQQEILNDEGNWLDANTDWVSEVGGLCNLKEYGGEFDWFEITTIIEK